MKSKQTDNSDHGKFAEPYEQYEEVHPAWGWVMVIGLSLFVCGWAMLMHYLIPDVKRQWDFGQIPTTPAKTVYTTQEPPPRHVAPAQIAPLPEAMHKRQELPK